MKTYQQIEQIIKDEIPAITNGIKTIQSVVNAHPEIAAELQPRLEAAVWLQGARFALATRPGYIHDSRKYLEAKIASTQPDSAWHRLTRRYSPQRWVFNIAASAIVFILLVLVVNSTFLAARLSLPGDALYSTKLVIEDVHLALTFDQVRRTELMIGSSRERALEFVELVMEGEYDQLPTAASRMETDIIASLQSLERMDAKGVEEERLLASNFKDTLASEILMLNVLKSTSPETAHAGIEMAINIAQSGIFALR